MSIFPFISLFLCLHISRLFICASLFGMIIDFHRGIISIITKTSTVDIPSLLSDCTATRVKHFTDDLPFEYSTGEYPFRPTINYLSFPISRYPTILPSPRNHSADSASPSSSRDDQPGGISFLQRAWRWWGGRRESHQLSLVLKRTPCRH